MTTTPFKIGGRDSRLARIQTRSVIERLRRLLPTLEFEESALSSPGDRDRDTDLRTSPKDFFTRDLDVAVLDATLDLAVHSAKDMPESLPAGLDWVWLPWSEDRRDALVTPVGKPLPELPPAPRIGISSERRAEYCRRRFTNAELVPIRGNVDDRIRQLDEGRFDLIVTAAAALDRLDLGHRATERIPLPDLPTPDGQGTLALTFRADNRRALRLRSLFVKSVAFVGAGVGVAENCTLAGMGALRNAEVCLYDALLDVRLLDFLPATAVRIAVGKRCGNHHKKQSEINELLARYARRGQRIVRLKGGDPAVFGRLAEEVETLEALHLPFHVVPGISSLNAVSANSGILLTRRDMARGFTVVSGREKGGKITDLTATNRSRLPCVVFMATQVLAEVAAGFLADEMAPSTPATVVFNAGAVDETVVRGTLETIAELARPITDSETSPPGLLVVGQIAKFAFSREHGALRNRRVLLTCSDALLDRASERVRDLGGRPVRFPLIRLEPAANMDDIVSRISGQDWIVLSSPSSVRILFEALKQTRLDLRRLPKIVVSGPATARELALHGIVADAVPATNFGVQGIVEALSPKLTPGDRVLRLRSDAASSELADALRVTGAEVEDAILHRNVPVKHDALPKFDAVLFASASAVQSFVDQWGVDALNCQVVATMGEPTAKCLAEHGIEHAVKADSATTEATVLALAAVLECRTL
jgi:uroporphyrinogen III methyltransferase/synthase